jgi:elongation factor P
MAGEALKWVVENMEVQVFYLDGQPIDVEAPNTVELTITHTEPGLRGDTAQGGTKPATLETGVGIQVPLFIEQGERIKIDTRTGAYLSRA